MSFRNRLGLFFVLIVIVPMVAVAFLLFSLLARSEHSLGRANVGARYNVAIRIFDGYERDALLLVTSIANRDGILRSALAGKDGPRARRRARQLLRSRDVERIVFVRGGTLILKVGDKTALAPGAVNLKSPSGPIGALYLSVVDAKAYAAEVKRLTHLQVVVQNGSRTLASTLPASRKLDLPPKLPGTVGVGDVDYQVNAFNPDDFPGQKVRVVTLGVPEAKVDQGDRVKIAAILAAFLLLALACAVLVSRSLQEQLAGFLDAARKLAGGDFSAQVTTVGHDEFAGLGEEFNKMARELKRRIEELREAVHESLTDDLTGLPNRRAFDVTLTNRVRDLNRLGGTLGLVLLDLDNFKAINDTYGHPQGDRVLREFASVLHETSREIDHPARYGGEEFALLLPGTDLEGAFELSERVRRGIEALQIPLVDGSGTMRVTVSCGVAAMPERASESAALVTAADTALYEAKRSGKNKSVRAR